MNPYVWFNKKYDWMLANKKVFWVEILVYLSFGSVVVTAYKSLLPTFWLEVLFFSVLGFWGFFAVIRVLWLFTLLGHAKNDPFGEVAK